MKAILVIDVQMTEDGKHICDSCPVWDEKMCGCKYDFMTGHKGCPLKPMPQRKKNSIVHQGEINIDIPIDFLEKIHNQGYNACLEELENESNI